MRGGGVEDGVRLGSEHLDRWELTDWGRLWRSSYGVRVFANFETRIRHSNGDIKRAMGRVRESGGWAMDVS